jgi:hypothetical protein
VRSCRVCCEQVLPVINESKMVMTWKMKLYNMLSFLHKNRSVFKSECLL